MELWIRTQNKRNLYKIDGLFLTNGGDRYYINGYVHNQQVYLGEYKTEQRYLEVLDEIQKLLAPINDRTTEKSFYKENVDEENYIISLTNNIHNETNTLYEMPKE